MNWPLFGLMCIAALIGGLLPVQGVLNTQLGMRLSSSLLAALISFVVGGVALVVVAVITRSQWPAIQQLRDVPWWLYVGGTIGAAFVTAIIFMAPKIGIANVLAAGIVGQLVVSLFIDHYGWMGIPVQPLSVSRFVGAGLLLVGLYLIQRA